MARLSRPPVTMSTLASGPCVLGPSAPRVLKHDLPVTCVAFNCDGSRLATGSHDATVRIWDPATGKPLGPPLRHEGGVLGIAFDPDGNRIATCSDDNTARFWDTATGEPLTAQLKHGGNVQCVAIGPRGRFVLTGSMDGTARLWEVEPVPSSAVDREASASQDDASRWRREMVERRP